jgi:glucose-6-phosphate-specific signal transduction histidine kinase
MAWDLEASRDQLGALAEEQGALRHVATLVAKHAGAGGARVTARVEHRELRVEIHNDGVGGARGDHGGGLGGLEDRVSALGGSLELESPSGAGTRVCALLPLATDANHSAGHAGS